MYNLSFAQLTPSLSFVASINKHPVSDKTIKSNVVEGYGVRSDGKILFINASTCDINYLPCNPPVVFDVPLPEGQFRDW